MPKFGERNCKVCGSIYKPTGPAAKYCDECKIIQRKAVMKAHNRKRRIKKGLVVDVGKGGSNKNYKEHPQYKTGMGRFRKLGKYLKETVNACQRCGKSLADVGRYGWCLHHKDRDRTHNELENLELLCKRCHQLEHDCIKALPN